MPVLLPRPSRARFLLLAGAALCLCAGPAEARRSATSAAAQPDAQPGVAWASGEAQPPNCTRGRRKFWQAGEGWVVRTITACR
ncbi:hypothetical protein [Methylobacterium nigriterrae]|uniref:hypothetical protein n=1 Tax=Methylobacterium nigriterrae TaxID=3127512 RepID=UPI0030135B62